MEYPRLCGSHGNACCSRDLREGQSLKKVERGGRPVIGRQGGERLMDRKSFLSLLQGRRRIQSDVQRLEDPPFPRSAANPVDAFSA